MFFPHCTQQAIVDNLKYRLNTTASPLALWILSGLCSNSADGGMYPPFIIDRERVLSRRLCAVRGGGRSTSIPPGWTRPDREGSSTSGRAKTATKRSFVDNANPGIASLPCAWSIEMRQCSAARTVATLVCAAVTVARSGGRALKQESVPCLGCSDVSVWYAQEAADQAARAPWPPGCQHGRGSS